ncbi:MULTISPECIES: amidase [unclassified Burkholderia]|uniref:amidase n=1 Tax=unclassified Burkholderia TaxID=2613784 RepID=UPI002AB17B92|nr:MULTISPECIES: amidase [unclassified Burkholderia]
MTQSDLYNLTSAELVHGFSNRYFSPVDVMNSVLERTRQVNPKLNAFFFLDEEGAFAAAKASEGRWLKGVPLSFLDGVPVSIKDSFATQGMPMWRGASAYKDRPPSSVDCPPVARLREAGALIFAKATMPDMGMFGAGVSTAHGITRNPWNLAYNPGGSSSGGAAAVAGRLGPLTVGSDIGGSVRLPASLCGLVSLKPTQGRIPHLPPSPIRAAGPIARTVEDAARMLTVLAQQDARDYGSLPPEDLQYHCRLKRDVKGLRIGVMLDMGFGLSPEDEVVNAIVAAADVFRSAGAVVETMPRLMATDPIPLLVDIFGVRSRIELEHLPVEKRALVHPKVRELCAHADKLSALEYGEASDRLEAIKAQVVATTGAYDYVISPNLPVVNFPAEDVAPDPDVPLSVATYTCLFNQTGQPAATVCCGFDKRGLPIGLQIIGNRFDDLGVLQVAAFYEHARGFDVEWPDV